MENYFLTCPRGLEDVTKKQISNYINTPIVLDKGGVHFNGNLKDMYAINLHSRTGMRVLKNLFSFYYLLKIGLIYSVDMLKFQ